MNKKEKNQQIQVFVRVRPLNRSEGLGSVVELRGNKELFVKHHSVSRGYTFDRVFGPDSQQIDVYKLVAEPTVREVIAGYNCTVFAYGQTGTGKTYTMAGGEPGIDSSSKVSVNQPWFEDIHAGIIPRTLAQLFDELRTQQLEYTVRVSYLELYNEEIFDLLSPVDDNSKLKLYDDNLKKGSVIVHGLTETTVNSKSEVYKILEKGSEKRRVASTLMNSQSSRSHTVFFITVHTKENSIDGEDLLKTGKLYLVDLAGSENIKQSGATEMRAREACSINQSLLTLGRCIAKLLERSPHIPYRESKLTRLLQDSLGGRTKTTLIATISPGHCNVDETLNTLDYACRAKCITNKPEINQRLSKKALLKEYTEEIERLRKDLVAARMGKGMFVDKENYESLIRALEISKEEIIEKVDSIRMLKDQMDLLNSTCNELKMSVEDKTQQIEMKSSEICSLETKVQENTKTISELKEENDLRQFLVDKHCETENALHGTMKKLICVADVTTADTEKLHNKIDVMTENQECNKTTNKQYMDIFSAKIDDVQCNLKDYYKRHNNFVATTVNILQCVESNNEKFRNYTESTLEFLLKFKTKLCDEEEQCLSDLKESKLTGKQTQDVLISKMITAQTNIHNIFKSETSASLANLILKFDNMKKANNYCTNGLKDMILDFEKFVYHSVSGITTKIVEMKKDFTTFSEKFLNENANLQAQIDQADILRCNQQLIIEESFKKLMLDFNETNKLFKSHFVMSNDQFKKFRDDAQLIHNGFKASEQKVFDIMANTVNPLCALQKDIKNKFLSARTFINDKDESFNTESHTVEDAITQMESKLKLLDDGTRKEFEQLKVDTDNECANYTHLADQHYSEKKSRIADSKGDVEKIETELNTHNKKLCVCIDNAVQEMSIELADIENACSENDSALSAKLDSFRNDFRKAFVTDVKEYKQTGVTPVRKRYKYPRLIVKTKPREELIKEFQELHGSNDFHFTRNGDACNPGMVLRSFSDSNILKNCPPQSGAVHKEQEHRQPHPGLLFGVQNGH